MSKIKKINKYVLASVCLLLLLGVFVFDRPEVAAQAPKAPAPSSPQQVLVVNTSPTQNVPISGIVGITGAPIVSAGQSGSWNVGQYGVWNVGITGTPTVGISGTPNVAISGTPKVTVGNPPTSPALVQDAPKTPVLTENSIGLAAGTTSSSTIIAYTVPVGKRLVIEFASVIATVGAGQGGGVQLATRDSDGIAHSYFLAATPLPGGTIVVGSQQMRLYADNSASGGEVFLFFSRTNGTTGFADVHISLSGYLVDVAP